MTGFQGFKFPDTFRWRARVGTVPIPRTDRDRAYRFWVFGPCDLGTWYLDTLSENEVERNMKGVCDGFV